MMGLHELFAKSLSSSHKRKIRRVNASTYEVKDGDSGACCQFGLPGKEHVALRVELKDIKLFSDSPPFGVAKMCDALFIVRHLKKNTVIAVEMKANDEGQYVEQIQNGCRLCKWLVQLFEDHGHFAGKPKDINYLGLLVWQTNPSQPLKHPIDGDRERPQFLKRTNIVELHEIRRSQFVDLGEFC